MTFRSRISSGVYAELTGTPDAARQARALIGDLLGDDHPTVDDAALIVSEMVSNAIAHSQSGQPGGTLSIAVEMAPQPGDVRIQVRDFGDLEAPVLTTASPDSEHGRGLAIITALAAEWGSETSHAGHATWCRLSSSRRAAEAAFIPEREAG
jgi:anti-sigma regulatory factor (Ser/Thr protein kinase)